MRVRVTFALAFCAAIFVAGIATGLVIDVADNVIVRYQRDVIADEAHSSLTSLLSTAEELEAACAFLYDVHESLIETPAATPVPRPPDAGQLAFEVRGTEVEVEVDEVDEVEVEEQPLAAVQPIPLPTATARAAPRGQGAF